jgi:hypothetical protein
MGRLRQTLSPELVAAALSLMVLTGVLASGTLAGVDNVAPSSPSAGPTATARPSPTLDGAVRGALLNALASGQRLAERATELEAAMTADPADGARIATILRAVNITVAAAARSPQVLATEPTTAELGSELASFYETIIVRNEETLRASIQDASSYVAGADAVLVLLADLPAFDDRISDALAGRIASLPSASASSAPSTTPPASTGPSATTEPSSSTDPSSSPTTPNAIENGTFDEGLTGWRLVTDATAVATLTHDPAGGQDGSGAARVDITVGSPARAGIALVSAMSPLDPGVTYRVDVRMRAAGLREVRIGLSDATGLTTTARVFQVGPSWTVASFDVLQLVGEPTVRFSVDLGRSDAAVWLDDVAIRVAEAAAGSSAP